MGITRGGARHSRPTGGRLAAGSPHVWHRPLAVWAGPWHLVGLRLNMYIAILMTLAALAWFALAQRLPSRPVVPREGQPAQDTGQSSAEPPAPVRKNKNMERPTVSVRPEPRHTPVQRAAA